MGRRKIEIKPIRDDRNRSVTFLKRKGGLFKKAHELSVLCSVDVAVVIFGHNKKLYEYSSSDINEIVGRFQYYGGAHEHKGPADFIDKTGGGDDDEDDEGVDEGDERGTPAPPEQSMMPQHMQMQQQHPGFQHVRHGTPGASPPIPNGAMPQFQRGPSPLPPGVMSRPASRTSQHAAGHIRRTSSNLVPPHLQQQQQQQQQGPPPQPSYAYTPNPPFYNPAAQMQPRPVQQGHQATHPPPYPPNAPHPQIQQAFLQDNRRSSMPPAFPAQPPAPPANMQRNASQDHLQPPQPRPHPSPQPQQQQSQPQPPHRPTPSPQPQQHRFTSPPLPQPKPLPAHAKAHSIFTPIDDSRSMLAQHWGTSSNAAEPARSDAPVKLERPSSIDVASMQRKANGATSPRPPPARPPPMRSPQPPPRSNSSSSVPMPTRSNTNQSTSDAKRPRLKVQIPSEQSGDEGGGSAPSSTGQQTSTSNPHHPQQPHQQPHGMVLPPPSPSAGALLSAGAQGPPNPFARPAPPMSTNPHAMNRDPTQPSQQSMPPQQAQRDSNHIETPISALPSRFMSDNLLPSPSTFYPEWGFGRSGGGGSGDLLPSPLNFATPVVAGMGPGQGWGRGPPERSTTGGSGVGGEEEREREREGGAGQGRKRAGEEEGEGVGKRTKM